MPTRPHHRKLTDHLAGWDADRIARLLQRRPDLAQPEPPVNIAELAQHAQFQPSVVAAIESATLPEHRVMQLVVCCRPNVRVDELAAALPEGTALGDVEATLVSLEDAALVWRHDGRVHCSGTLRQAMPTMLGPPLQTFAKNLTVDHLRHALVELRAGAAEGGFDGRVPPMPTGPSGKAPRKAELVDTLETMLTTPGLVAAVLAAAPPQPAELARAMAEGHPAVELVFSLYFSRYGGSSAFHGQDGSYWLFERALLLPGGQGEIGLQPREVGVALRGGRPVDDLALDRPALVTGAADPRVVDAHAAARAARTLHLLADLVDLWSATPATALKSGGLGVKAMKTVAATLEVDADEAGRLVELAHLAGLVASTTTSRKEGRRYVQDTVVGPTPAAAAWVERPLARRGAQLAAAWLRAEHWPSASGRAANDRDRKPAPVLSHQYADTAPARRRDVLEMLGTLEVTQSTSPVALEACVYWQRPQPWLRIGGVTSSDAIGWVYAEAELLGVVGAGALSSFGRALAGGDAAGAERGLAAALPAPARTFTLQTDLTATVVGDLDRDMLVELRLLADVESTGAATILRFSDASVRRAVDAGRHRETILAFLEAHAAKGVPPALAYLVNDVARRHGHLVVGAAGAFVTSDDPAVLADACSHRRTRKLALRLLAPTVAVSPRAPDAVLDGLRAAGFLPVADAETPGEITLAEATAAPSAGRAPGTATRGGATADRLPEPFRARSGPGRPSVPALDDAAASALAEQIVAGWVDAAPTTPREPFLPFPHGDPYAADDIDDLDDLDLMFDGDDVVEVESLDEVLASAAESSSVVAIALGSGDELAEPILLAVAEWEPGRVAGVDLSDGVPMSILTEHIGAALELGLASDLLPPEPRRAGRRPTSGRRRR